MILRKRPLNSSLLMAGVLSGMMVALCGRSTKAQAPAGKIPFAGTQVFCRYVLHDLFKLVPTTVPEELDKTPRDSVVIIFGDTAGLNELGLTPDWLRRFRGSGGAILIASDRADAGSLRSLNVRISGDVVHQNAHDAYLGREECPLLKDMPAGHPIFKHLGKGVATNQPSCLQNRESLQTLVHFPPTCWIVQGKGTAAIGPSCAYIVGSRAESTDRVLIIGGHGAFLNDMMAQHDNDNFAFACNCIDWLTSLPRGGRRKHALFVENDKIHERFDVPLTAMPALPLPSSRVINNMLRGLEEENFFNRLLVAMVGRDRILRIVLLFLSAGLLVYTVTRLVRARHRGESGVPLLLEGAPPAREALALMSQRDRDVIRGGNLWEAARGLARSCFTREPWQGRSAGPPRVVAAGWWRRQRLARQVQELWNLAYGPQPIPVPPRKFARIAAAVDEVRAALAAGALRLEEPRP